jgi:hypothetical protein
MQALPIVYRLALSAWLGGSALFTFVLTPILFRAYDRDMAGSVVGVLMPAYFRWGLACGVVALVSLLAGSTLRKGAPAAILAAMLLVTAVHAFVIEPRAAALKKEIPSFVTTPPDHPLRREFRKIHAISQAGNLGVIGGAVALVVLL